jgi:hypothetical protein
LALYDLMGEKGTSPDRSTRMHAGRLLLLALLPSAAFAQDTVRNPEFEPRHTANNFLELPATYFGDPPDRDDGPEPELSALLRALDALDAAQRGTDTARSQRTSAAGDVARTEAEREKAERRLARVEQAYERSADDGDTDANELENLQRLIDEDRALLATLDADIQRLAAALSDAEAQQRASEATLVQALADVDAAQRAADGPLDPPGPDLDELLADEHAPASSEVSEPKTWNAVRLPLIPLDLWVDISLSRELFDDSVSIEEVAATLTDALRARKTRDPALDTYTIHHDGPSAAAATPESATTQIAEVYRSHFLEAHPAQVIDFGRRASGLMDMDGTTTPVTTAADILLNTLANTPGWFATAQSWSSASYSGTSLIFYSPETQHYVAFVATEPTGRGPSQALSDIDVTRKPAMAFVGGIVEVN